MKTKKKWTIQYCIDCERSKNKKNILVCTFFPIWHKFRFIESKYDRKIGHMSCYEARKLSITKSDTFGDCKFFQPKEK